MNNYYSIVWLNIAPTDNPLWILNIASPNKFAIETVLNLSEVCFFVIGNVFVITKLFIMLSDINFAALPDKTGWVT